MSAARNRPPRPGGNGRQGHRVRAAEPSPAKDKPVHALFDRAAKWVAAQTGKPVVFIAAVLGILLWAVSGPIFGFSDTWQLIVNTSTTIVTFLMVFLIQNTQNRDTGALQVKLDELIRVVGGAHNALLDLEELDARELEHIRRRYRELAELAREAVRRGEIDTDKPDVELFENLHRRSRGAPHGDDGRGGDGSSRVRRAASRSPRPDAR